ncbi:Hypothetical protein NG00_01508 [Corynebacterium camporealensis]|uniref:Uncharacterized protein n=1 Tax=Corynebacterium camporealensis TaxID=161896 RepID=A0A0F6TBQ1_9CORY|nr:hypothetical protein [Corynebacterium camporealensis]AKE39614.1 hypothetical protein UL81_08310 [Corynebacterium camporealensis]AVH88749.1 Hypothetical protein NG00_01508 [Corynebacterium camporealensis]MDY5840433.1 hypothetical protein [Corynebacterium camporealensis]
MNSVQSQPTALSVDPWPEAPVAEPVVSGVLHIEGMPRTLRPVIERAMYRCIATESVFVVPNDDPLTAQWCTRWYREGAGIGCRQVLTGTAAELRALNSAVSVLAGEYGFSGKVEH